MINYKNTQEGWGGLYHIFYSWGKSHIRQAHQETARVKQKVNKKESQWSPLKKKLQGSQSAFLSSGSQEKTKIVSTISFLIQIKWLKIRKEGSKTLAEPLPGAPLTHPWTSREVPAQPRAVLHLGTWPGQPGPSPAHGMTSGF